MQYQIKGEIHYRFIVHRYIKVDGIYEGESSDEALELATDQLMPDEAGEPEDTDPDVKITVVEEAPLSESQINYNLMLSLGEQIAPTLFPIQ